MDLLPANKDKQVDSIHKKDDDLNILQSKKKYELNEQSLSTDVTKQVNDLYFRDDIVYQAPARGDTISVTDIAEKKVTEPLPGVFVIRIT